jgi:hypothetical protein
MLRRLLGFILLAILISSMSLAGLAAGDAINATVTQNTRGDFEAGCAVFSGTQASDLGDQGSVILAADFTDDFLGTSLTSAWTSGNYSGSDTPVVAGGLLTVPGGVYVQSVGAFTHGVLETRAEFGTSVRHNIGFSSDALNNKFLIFGVIDSTTLYARVSDGVSAEQRVDLGTVPSGLHRYTIVWTPVDATTDQVSFYIDGVLAAGPLTFNAAGLANSNVYYSNVFTGGANLVADYVRVAPTYAASGTYTSCTLDAGLGSAWQSIAWNAATPVGSGLTVEWQTSADGSTWSGWTTASSSTGSSVAPNRYLQYRLNLTGDTLVTPLVDSVTLLSMLWEGGAPLDYGQLDGLPGKANYVGWLNTSVNGAGIPTEVVTEDSYNAATGANLGYQNKYWLIAANKFTATPAVNGNTVYLLFGGLLADSGKLWSTNFVWNGGVVEHTPPAVLLAASGGECPVMLQGSFIPGNPAQKVVNWSGAAGKYHVYRSVTPSGASNGQSDGRYDYVGSVQDTGPNFSYTDSLPLGVTDSWHIVIPADQTTNAIVGCHTEAESLPTALSLLRFDAEVQGLPPMVIVVILTFAFVFFSMYFLKRRSFQ